MTRGRAILLGAAVVLAFLAPAAPSAAGEVGREPRLLVLSLPTLAWEDVYQGDTPAIDALLDESAVAAMSVRDVVRHTTPGDGYAAMSAGARARGVPTDGDVVEAGEELRGQQARAAYERATGLSAPADGLLALAISALDARNEDLDYGAEIGALGEALEEADVPRAAIANADGPMEEVLLHRTAGVAMVDRDGTVPGGAVAGSLLEGAPSAPYGVQLSPSAVRAAFDTAWSEGGVVLVEGSDLERADRYLFEVGSRDPAEVRRDALRSTDALVGDLLEEVDLARDSVLLVAPYHQRDHVHLTVAGMRSPEIDPGLLRSGSTRRTGIVTLVDIAPTILDLVDVERPSSMEGRRFERVADGAATGEARAADLADLDAAAQYRDHMVTPVAGLFVLLQALLWIGAAFAMRGSDPTGVAGRGAGRADHALVPAGHVPRAADPLPGRAGRCVLAVRVRLVLRHGVGRAGDRTQAPVGAAAPVPGRRVRAAHDRHAHRRPAPAERRVRLLTDGRWPLRGDGEPGLRPVRGRRLRALRAPAPVAHRATRGDDDRVRGAGDRGP